MGSEDKETKPEASNGIPKPIFGNASTGSLNFGAKPAGGFGGFGGFKAENEQSGFQFSFNKTPDEANPFKNKGKSMFGPQNGAEDTQGGEDNDECTAEFAPVLNQLPDLVEVKTGLEDEEEIFSERAKLFRFARECTPPEWKERGLGDIKITKNGNTNRYRIVMRREQVLKVCANHYISAEMSLAPMQTNEKALVWTAMDYGDANEPEGSVQQFCVRFKTPELAAQFKQAFEESQNKLLDNPDFTPGREPENPS